ncbi:capsule biosynthesis protein [Agrobacterium rosae]|uniref:capsule biosynthesis protein n=1 Tax=Agrobacterium rosae TaxID=1972867 RepID=UPI003BA162FC
MKIVKEVQSGAEVDQLPPGLEFTPAPPRRGLLRLLDFRKRGPFISLEEVDDGETPEPETGGPPWKAWSFFALVIVPSFTVLLYFAFYASDQFYSEARFAVRAMADEGTDTSVDAGSVSMAVSSQDAYIVTSFIQSAEVLRRLDGKVDYRKMFQYPDIDYFSRFPDDGQHEEFLRYWSKHVSAYVDGPSGITTISVRTFSPRDAALLTDALLKESEQLVNELSERARADMLAGFREEVNRTNGLYREALIMLQNFQQKIGLLSPADEAKQSGTLLADLLMRKLRVEDRMFVLQQSASTDAPGYRQLLSSRDSLDHQISELRSELTGSTDSALSNVMIQFTSLETDRLVAEQLYEAARRNYDRALASSIKKGLYLTVFVRPSLPEESLYPRRLASPFLIFLGLFVVWSTLMLILASIEDHRL